jgi:hypothetical protein
MLIDTIRRHDAHKLVKQISIEGMKKIGKPVPPQIHSVPALLLHQGNGKAYLYGKQVFDYLLAPGSGKLLTAPPPAHATNAPAGSTASHEPMEPSAFVLGSSLSDKFSMIENSDNHMDDRVYTWTKVDTTENVDGRGPYQEETRKKQELPDIDSIRAQRDLELNENYINVNALPPPSFTRP